MYIYLYCIHGPYGVVVWPFVTGQVADSIATWAAEANQVANPKARSGGTFFKGPLGGFQLVMEVPQWLDGL